MNIFKKRPNKSKMLILKELNKEILENVIYLYEDDKLIDFLDKHFKMPTNSIDIFENNLEVLKEIDKAKKILILARLEKIAEGNDLTGIFGIVITMFLAFLINYGEFIESLISNRLWSSIALIVIYLYCIIKLMDPMGISKGKRAKANYYKASRGE